MTDVDRVVHEVIGRLTGGLIHEMNNPLGVVLGFASEAQAAGPGSPQLPGDLQMIVQESKRLASLLSEWRAIVSLDAASATADVRAACRAVWRIFAYPARGVLTLKFSEEPGKKRAPPGWTSTMAAIDQLKLWLCVHSAMLDLAQNAGFKDAILCVDARNRGTIAIEIKLERISGDVTAPSAFASDCFAAASTLLNDVDGAVELDGQCLALAKLCS